MLLVLASCAAPKKAPYVKPVISAKTLEVETCKETLSEVKVKRVETDLKTYRRIHSSLIR